MVRTFLISHYSLPAAIYEIEEQGNKDNEDDKVPQKVEINPPPHAFWPSAMLHVLVPCLVGHLLPRFQEQRKFMLYLFAHNKM
jgi:hypothetical protein